MDDWHSCRLEQRGHVALVTLDRPEVLNALHPAAHRELDAVFDRLRDDDDVRVIVVTGSGRARVLRRHRSEGARGKWRS